MAKRVLVVEASPKPHSFSRTATAALLARLALVPRVLEARGLDASPAIRQKLAGVGDARGAEILDVILRDEIRHVRFGNTWYRALCLSWKR